MPMYNALRSTLWLGFFIGGAFGALVGCAIVLASYPYIEYGRVMFSTFMFFLLGTFVSYAILFGAEHMKARKSGMIYLWADYETHEILELMKENQLQMKL